VCQTRFGSERRVDPRDLIRANPRSTYYGDGGRHFLRLKKAW
jgi:hypothetical protein